MERKITVNLNNIERAKRFVNVAIEFDSDIDILFGRYVIDAKSIMGVFSLNLLDKLIVEIHSDDETEIKKFNEVMKQFM